MSQLFMFEKPLGMRDTLPNLYETKHRARSKMETAIKQWGYQFIETPTLEFFETVGAASSILNTQLFKLLDQQGQTLVLRPDMTTPIARLAASKLLKEDMPLRLAYAANVFRAQQREGGRPAEFEQIGVEAIADSTVSSDGEVIALLVSTLKSVEVGHFQISVGHIDFVQELFLQILGTEERADVLRRYLYEKNYVGYREHVKSLALSSIDKQRLLDFLKLRGGIAAIANASLLVENERGKEALRQLQELYEILCDYEVEEFIQFDLTLVSHMSYYTGILFEVYAGKVGFPIANGGRYDQLLAKFGEAKSATGFGIRIDRLLEAIGGEDENPPTYCILFSGERRQEAFQLAAKKRAEGEQVVLQDINGVKSIDLFTKKFEEIHFLIGKKD